MALRHQNSSSTPSLHSKGDGVFQWSCQSHGHLISPKIACEKRPDWLTTKSIKKHTYLSKATGNVHGLKSCDYSNICWPLPKMFGDEKYAFTLIDIEDPRFAADAALMGRKLTKLNYEIQIIDMEWRRTLKGLLRAEQHEASLGNAQDRSASQRRVELAERIKSYKSHLLLLQEQKDMYETCISDIWTRCDEIKKSIRQENDLESLRQECSDRVRQSYMPDDEFWEQKFNVTSPKNKTGHQSFFPNIHSVNLDE